jgi:hypothetical protein
MDRSGTERLLRDGVDSALCRGPSTKAGRTDNSSPKVGDAGGKHIRGSDGNWVKVSSGFVIPGVVTTDPSQKKVTDYFHDTPSPDQLRARAQRLIDQRKAAQAAADAHQVKAYQALRATGERCILVQARAWEATQIEAQRLFKQAEEEQGLRDAIGEVTDQAQAEHQRRQPPTPGGKRDTGAAWEGQGRGYSGEPRDDLEGCGTCKGLFPMATMRYYGGEVHCPRCYTSKGTSGGEGRHDTREQAHTGDMAALLGAAVRETLKAASQTTQDTTVKDSKLAAILATTIQPLQMKGGLIQTHGNLTKCTSSRGTTRRTAAIEKVIHMEGRGTAHA